MADEFEERLIHFKAARKLHKSSNAPYFLCAKTVKQYIDTIPEPYNKRLSDCYSALCEVTHPASRSVQNFFSESENIIVIKKDMDFHNINDFCRDYCDILYYLLQVVINHSLVSLKLINHLPVEELHTTIGKNKQAEDEFFEILTGWNEFKCSLCMYYKSFYPLHDSVLLKYESI
ncbi:hypothetical protein [Desulfosporosinus sp. OT]|uniref:hypothetical protein n=1 Tax=Desulfosporosinus sp. OT TaxID=913865 RepID=UPI000223A2B7|nr:hypothetical protein [Desulfosporosinus sp. OT]EGW39270.1 hypothetical protein DOT_2795 [Desulfosporosinus sp. OT]